MKFQFEFKNGKARTLGKYPKTSFTQSIVEWKRLRAGKLSVSSYSLAGEPSWETVTPQAIRSSLHAFHFPQWCVFSFMDRPSPLEYEHPILSPFRLVPSENLRPFHSLLYVSPFPFWVWGTPRQEGLRLNLWCEEDRHTWVDDILVALGLLFLVASVTECWGFFFDIP